MIFKMDSKLELGVESDNLGTIYRSQDDSSLKKCYEPNKIRSFESTDLCQYGEEVNSSPFTNQPPNSYIHDNPYDKISIPTFTKNEGDDSLNFENDRVTENYTCPQCFKTFKTKLCLRYHIDVHNPRKPYVCSIPGCDRAFRTPKYLKNHCDEFHRKQPKKYHCPVDFCNAVFQRKTHLKRHLSSHTESEKKFSCSWPECRYRTCSREKLDIHYSIHTGEKEYNCILCSFKGTEKDHLSEHYRVEHAKGNPELFIDNNNSSSGNNNQIAITSSSAQNNTDAISNCDSSKNWNSSKMSQYSGCEKVETMSEFSCSQKNDSSSNILPMVLSLLEKSDKTQMTQEEIIKSQEYVKSLLPPITTGNILQNQVEDIYNDLIDKLQAVDPSDYLKNIHSPMESLNDDELHVIEILDHQLRSGSTLTIPYPPRKRGRRPKLQQKLRPYIEKLFNIETCVADMLISLLCGSNGYGWNNSSSTLGPSQKKDNLSILDNDDEFMDYEYNLNYDEGSSYQNNGNSHDCISEYVNNKSVSNEPNGQTSLSSINNKTGCISPNLPPMTQFSTTSSYNSNNNNALSESGYCSSSQESHQNVQITSPNSSTQNACESPRTLSSNNSANLNAYQNVSMSYVASPSGNPPSTNSSSSNSNGYHSISGCPSGKYNRPVDHLQFLSEMGAKYTNTNNVKEFQYNPPNQTNMFPSNVRQQVNLYEEHRQTLNNKSDFQHYKNSKAYHVSSRNATGFNNKDATMKQYNQNFAWQLNQKHDKVYPLTNSITTNNNNHELSMNYNNHNQFNNDYTRNSRMTMENSQYTHPYSSHFDQNSSYHGHSINTNNISSAIGNNYHQVQTSFIQSNHPHHNEYLMYDNLNYAGSYENATNMNMQIHEKSRMYQSNSKTKNYYSQNAQFKYQNNSSYPMYTQPSNFYENITENAYSLKDAPLVSRSQTQLNPEGKDNEKVLSENSFFSNRISNGNSIYSELKTNPSFSQWPGESNDTNEHISNDPLSMNDNFTMGDGETNNFLSSITNPYQEIMNPLPSNISPDRNMSSVGKITLQETELKNPQDENSKKIFTPNNRCDLIQIN